MDNRERPSTSSAKMSSSSAHFRKRRPRSPFVVSLFSAIGEAIRKEVSFVVVRSKAASRCSSQHNELYLVVSSETTAYQTNNGHVHDQHLSGTVRRRSCGIAAHSSQCRRLRDGRCVESQFCRQDGGFLHCHDVQSTDGLVAFGPQQQQQRPVTLSSLLTRQQQQQQK